MIVTLKELNNCLQQLEERRACENQVRLFERLFGEQVKVTKALCLKHANDFRFEWAALYLLSPLAQAEYEKLMKPARAKTQQAMVKGCAAPTLHQFKKAMKAVITNHDKAEAVAFWAASKMQDEQEKLNGLMREDRQ